MYGLTLWRPMDWAMAHGGKDLENRKRRPWKRIIGTRIALHAGLKYDYDYAEFIKRTVGLDTLPESKPGVIVATTRVVGWLCVGADENRKAGSEVLASAPEFLELRNSPWFIGPYGWVVRDTIALPKPVPCKGAQGLWLVPADKELEVLRQEHLARSA